MVPLFSTPWLGYIRLKHRLFGLMPLQGLVNKYHQQDQEGRDPLWTYWLLITYEKEVMEALDMAKEKALAEKRDVEEAEKEAYKGISNELRNPGNEAHHNINKKVFLHLLGLAVIFFLMIGIGASNTMNLTGFLTENGIVFGAYTNIVTGSFYAAAVWAQWMIFRRGVTKMLKSLFSWSNGGLDFFETADLELAAEGKNKYSLRLKKEDKGGVNDNELPRYYSRRRRTLFYWLCTAACAMAWGTLVYTKSSHGLESTEGFFGIEKTLAGDLGIVFGSLAGFAACFLWLTALRTQLKNEEKGERAEAIKLKKAKEEKEKEEEKNKNNVKNHDQMDDNDNNKVQEHGQGKDKSKSDITDKEVATEAIAPWYKSITDKPVVLSVLIAATLYALLSSMLGQARIVFETFGWENNNGNPLDPRHPLGVLYFGVFLCAIFTGRMLFTVKAMETFYENATRTWKATTWDKIYQETFHYRSNYVVGIALMVGLVGFFAASTQVDVLRKPMTEGSNGHRIFSPMGIAIVGAMLVWTLFLVLKRFSDGTAQEADKKEAFRDEKTAWFPPDSVGNGFEDRTGNALVAAVGNGVAYGGMGGTGLLNTVGDIGEATVPVGAAQPGWVAPTGVVLAAASQGTLALQSFTTSTQARGLIQVDGNKSRNSVKYPK